MSAIASGADLGTRVAPVVLGVDVGSTTVKAVVVDPSSREVLWHAYRRHHTRQPDCVLEMIAEIRAAMPMVDQDDIRIFVTGSGSGPLAEPLGAKFVQEVNAVTLAVEHLHPEVQAVVELGGQDAKIIQLRIDPKTGNRQVGASMNDKCASGTGATIDKCMIKVGMPEEEVRVIQYDPGKLHHVAAKCGVFAETDIVNLIKTGVPGDEILNSLADAIVCQNLAVLTRGMTLMPRVLLLGGPNTYLPFLVACWRKRIAETWVERDVVIPDEPVEALIFVPAHAELYAALGAVFYGLHEPAEVGRFAGVEALAAYAGGGRQARLAETAGPPLVIDRADADAFAARYQSRRFEIRDLPRGSTVRCALGLDGGSTSSKCVLVGEDGELLLKAYQLSRGNPILDMREMLGSLRDQAQERGWTLEIVGFGVTGYAGPVLEKALRADVHIVETVAHMQSAVHYFGDVDVICDIGGQDIKVLFMRNGQLENFRLSNQCSAGNGMLLQAMADQFGMPVTEYADAAFNAKMSPTFSYGCAVFLDADRVTFQKEGYAKEEMLAGLALVLPKNVWQYVVQIPRMAQLGNTFVLQGGTQHNLAAVKAQVDYILERVPGGRVFVHPYPGEAGALGVAMEVLRRFKRGEQPRWVGLDAAIGLEFTSVTSEETRCHFCPNECSRTFIDTRTPDGDSARYISGFSCEKGTVEDDKALKELVRRRAGLRKRWPNLVEWEARELFRHRFDPAALPAADTLFDTVETTVTRTLAVERTEVRRTFERSDAAAHARRRKLRIGIPKVLNIWSTAPFFRTYFESLGLARHNVVFSGESGEEMFAEGGKYGAIDPCYPSKVAQAHVHELLFSVHSDKPLHAIFVPGITHVRTPLLGVMDSASCPIVQGIGDVIKAAFTKEKDYFGERNLEYFSPAVSFTEPHLLADQLFGAMGEWLGVTRDESDFAAEQAWLSLDNFEGERQRQGLAILDEVERDNRIAILMIGRPYHSDPGMNHEVTAEFQALGYPILSMGSIPKDPAWLARFFPDAVAAGTSPLDINDVWPENYSSNSAQKVWAAKFASRHPNVAVLDLSSFKCGNDAPIYGVIDRIIGESATPYSALHDVDANKPGGSIGIRVRTYGYTLSRQQERLDDLGHRKAELTAAIDEKRRELVARYQAERLDAQAVLAASTARRPEPLTSDGRASVPARREPSRLLVPLGRLAGKARSLRERLLA